MDDVEDVLPSCTWLFGLFQYRLLGVRRIDPDLHGFSRLKAVDRGFGDRFEHIRDTLDRTVSLTAEGICVGYVRSRTIPNPTTADEG